MKSEDLGVDPITKFHDQRLTPLENRFLGILWTDHVGLRNAISADALADLFLPEFPLEEAKRDVRKMHNHLLMMHSKIPVLSKAGPGGGYYIAEDRFEADRFYAEFRARGMTGIVKATRGRQAEMVDLVEQISFEFDDLVDKTGGLAHARTAAAAKTPVEVVDAILGKMLLDPGKYADGLKKIGRKYGSVLLPKEQLVAIRNKVKELQEMAAGLE